MFSLLYRSCSEFIYSTNSVSTCLRQEVGWFWGLGGEYTRQNQSPSLAHPLHWMLRMEKRTRHPTFEEPTACITYWRSICFVVSCDSPGNLSLHTHVFQKLFIGQKPKYLRKTITQNVRKKSRLLNDLGHITFTMFLS